MAESDPICRTEESEPNLQSTTNTRKGPNGPVFVMARPERLFARFAGSPLKGAARLAVARLRVVSRGLRRRSARTVALTGD
jgi:hypothetical protein